MKKSSKTIIAFVSVFALVLLLLSGCILGGSSYLDKYAALSQKMALMQKYFEAYSINDFDEELAEDFALKYFMGGLNDQYAYYFSKEEMEDFQNDFIGQTIGIGIEVWHESQILDNGLFVYRVLSGSPAYNAGVKAGDRIISVDGVSLDGFDYDEAVNRILGDAGKAVELTILRDGVETSLSIVRSEYSKVLVEDEMIGDIALIRIYEFASVTAAQLRECLFDIIDAGAKRIIFDVRNNPGGDYEAITEVLNLLLPDGELIVTRRFNSREDSFYSHGDAMIDLPMTVIANGNSASAAELFVSCLRDTLNVPIVGQTTYGKGVGQSVITFDDGTGMKFTTFEFLTKSRIDFDGKGLVPDYEVSASDEEKMNIFSRPHSEDSQLQKAIEVVSGLTEK